MNRGSIRFAADDGTEFSLPVKGDGSCGPLPRAGKPVTWEPPAAVGHIQLKDAQSASDFAESLKSMGFEVTTHRSDDA